MKRVRTLYQNSCSEILKMRDDVIATNNTPINSIDAYNEFVLNLQKEHGDDWCLERALVPLPNSFLFTVVMPVFNEAKTIASMIDRVCKVDLPLELVVVDDGSTDGTTDVLRELELRTNGRTHNEKGQTEQGQNGQGATSFSNAFGAIKTKYLYHDRNEGKGAALKTGFLAATGDVVGIQDADQEYDPQEFIVLLSTIIRDEADVVYGSRFAAGNKTNSPGWHKFGNGLITWFSNRMTGLNVTDAETCYKLMRKSCLDKIVEGLKEKRFGIELEMTAKLAKNKSIRFDERPISYDKRTYAEGKKIGIKDGFRALWCILKY